MHLVGIMPLLVSLVHINVWNNDGLDKTAAVSIYYFFSLLLDDFFFLLFTCNLIYRNDSNFILIPGNVNFCKSVKQCMFVFYIMRLVIMSVFYH